MLTAEGCAARRERLWEALPSPCDVLVVGDPSHLTYFAGYSPSPFVFRTVESGRCSWSGDGPRSSLMPCWDHLSAQPMLMSEWRPCGTTVSTRLLIAGASSSSRQSAVLRRCRGNGSASSWRPCRRESLMGCGWRDRASRSLTLALDSPVAAGQTRR